MTETLPDEWFEVRYIAYVRTVNKAEAERRAPDEVCEMQIISHGQRDPRLDILNEESDKLIGGDAPEAPEPVP